METTISQHGVREDLIIDLQLLRRGIFFERLSQEVSSHPGADILWKNPDRPCKKKQDRLLCESAAGLEMLCESAAGLEMLCESAAGLDMLCESAAGLEMLCESAAGLEMQLTNYGVFKAC